MGRNVPRSEGQRVRARREPGHEQPGIEALLDGGDRRSVGQVGRVVRRATRDATVVAALVAALRSKRPLVRLRAADALEKISRRDAKPLGSYRRQLTHAVARTSDPVVRWNLIQLLPRIPHDRDAMRRLARRLEAWFLSDASAIVRVSALDAVAAFARQDAMLEPLAQRMVLAGLTSPMASVRARARRLDPGLRSVSR